MPTRYAVVYGVITAEFFVLFGGDGFLSWCFGSSHGPRTGCFFGGNGLGAGSARFGAQLILGGGSW